ncbi:MAG: ATP-binding protein [Flexistipes sinusarabici]|uniref:ATP-binding protein n=1 Tax=Flexistipes sinusarabici TaxID=2352 RepID=A0A5D0MHC4_FLESI|nr:ATP-binding protein [Flexistipes sinusarabici]TYB33124.1 MAG: ATP-binding protein [Flexistipes sinusarabici]
MKKIACFLQNINFYQELYNAAAEEGFEVQDTGSHFEKLSNYILFVTDDSLAAERTANSDLPVAFTSHSGKFQNVFNLKIPFDKVQFKSLLDQLMHGVTDDLFSRISWPEFIRKSYLIGNDIYQLDKIIFFITRELIFFAGISEIQKIRIGLSEMLANAVEHGNLGISADEKFRHTEEGTYEDFLKSRIENLKYYECRVRLEIYMDKNTVEFTIEDEGRGFDVEKAEFQAKGDDLLKLHGRGIMLTKIYFDSVEYNKKGNKVVIRKFLS